MFPKWELEYLVRKGYGLLTNQTIGAGVFLLDSLESRLK